jgi:hypothetical protein
MVTISIVIKKWKGKNAGCKHGSDTCKFEKVFHSFHLGRLETRLKYLPRKFFGRTNSGTGLIITG